MKKLITLVFAAFSTLAFSQNQQINPTDNSQVYPQQAAVYNNNKGSINAQQTNFNANANTDQLAQVTQQLASDQGGHLYQNPNCGLFGLLNQDHEKQNAHCKQTYFVKIFRQAIRQKIQGSASL